jgi:hypothetical protein
MNKPRVSLIERPSSDWLPVWQTEREKNNRSIK